MITSPSSALNPGSEPSLTPWTVLWVVHEPWLQAQLVELIECDIVGSGAHAAAPSRSIPLPFPYLYLYPDPKRVPTLLPTLALALPLPLALALTLSLSLPFLVSLFPGPLSPLPLLLPCSPACPL